MFYKCLIFCKCKCSCCKQRRIFLFSFYWLKQQHSSQRRDKVILCKHERIYWLFAKNCPAIHKWIMYGQKDFTGFLMNQDFEFHLCTVCGYAFFIYSLTMCEAEDSMLVMFPVSFKKALVVSFPKFQTQPSVLYVYVKYIPMKSSEMVWQLSI